MRYYWHSTCPFCNQGRLILTKDKTNNKIYLHCEECERGWYNIDELKTSKGFLTLTEEFETENPSLEEIERLGWRKAAKYNFDE